MTKNREIRKLRKKRKKSGNLRELVQYPISAISTIRGYRQGTIDLINYLRKEYQSERQKGLRGEYNENNS